MEIKNFDKIVNTVTKNVIKKLDKNTTVNSDKTGLILLPNINIGIAEYYAYIVKKYPDYKFYLGTDSRRRNLKETQFSEQLEFVDYDMNNSDFVSLLDRSALILVLGLKVTEMQELAQMNDNRDINSIIVARLLANKPVGILVNANTKIHNHIAGILESIRGLGIDVINIANNFVDKQEKIDLITEAYVQNLANAGVKKLAISKKQPITPLAKDKLRELKISVDYIEEE